MRIIYIFIKLDNGTLRTYTGFSELCEAKNRARLLIKELGSSCLKASIYYINHINNSGDEYRDKTIIYEKEDK